MSRAGCCLGNKLFVKSVSFAFKCDLSLQFHVYKCFMSKVGSSRVQTNEGHTKDYLNLQNTRRTFLFAEQPIS